MRSETAAMLHFGHGHDVVRAQAHGRRRFAWLFRGVACWLKLQGTNRIWSMYGRVREEGNTRSRVMDYASELIDRIGPRLTGSPNPKGAVAWARKVLEDIGCSNARAESWGEFGMGWQERNVWLRMTRPDTAPLIARAAPWSPATPGPVSGEVVAVRGFTHDKEFEPYRGKLAGKIVLLGTAPSPPEVFPIERPLFERLSDRELENFAAQPLQRSPGYQQYQDISQAALARFDFPR